MSNENQMPLQCMTDRDLPLLAERMVGIRVRRCQRIEEYSRRVLKGYAVFLEVRRCLSRIPLEGHPNQGNAEPGLAAGEPFATPNIPDYSR